MRGFLLAAATIAALMAPGLSDAANTPCSGKKGGVSHCQGRTFICNDGSVSASKKNCAAEMGAAGLLSTPEMAPVIGDECSCRSGRFCIGPRGGHYCLQDNGRKSYLKK